MSGDKQASEAGRLRQQAEELELQAQRADPAEREQLMEKAVSLRARCQELGGRESATMDPM
ncbi:MULTISPECIES: DUF6381 family protein [Streptomyces]|uniref:Small hydrophilic protein n=1 Tax=Streptomyces virginiae TaxID=1961 RepID=A0ABQ3NP95_STRVG|nr:MULTISPECIES: DUF6381 family protein [Streptomyces]KOU26627.1 hypothetical protein ADK49_03410 [Streptomyces sp. WM6349]KOU91025.1 hypothetical protein ADK92_33185 [Streptomyces sp. XY533]KOU91304.1 hypothetical protein ADK94_07890 [Streptomyces sp. XY593]KOV13447.1 hypothetical protein ADK91_08730 [Streptomyces sp. XY511]KOV36691.1 hypothetical protein ADK98_38790 [Streptomyces sp. H036]